ncbi:formylglycine-generating enzyme family protein [Pseudoduganella lutea]|uniref:Formylglycine-generating enzyme family protein n=2 Tax=Pseudoduganella lutea TaxID=321985 RepID=A0A4P6L5T9_9BURK|nr:formylglycine-generating enzyme family protein [Pseudoduganella lutea]
MMVHDRYFYDPVAGRYTVDRYLDDLVARYGGIDSVLVWPIYPNIGIDNRNQLDMIEHLPGGKEGVKRMVAEFKAHGVRVLFPVMPWDTGTRDPGRPLPDAVAALMKELGADGVNGDTMTGVPLAFSQAAEKIGYPLAFEPEIAPQEDQLGWNVMSWGYFDYPYANQNPAVHVAKFKWLEPRHMVHVNDRWQRDRADMLQFAFFNGVGIETWESVWGIWNGFTVRDSEALRRIATISRAFPQHLTSRGWEPMTLTRQHGVLASRWPHADSTLYTIVNRNEYGVNGEQLAVPHVAGMRYFDVYHGVELAPRRTTDGQDVLAFDLEGKGFGAVLATGAKDAALDRLLATMRPMSARPLASYDRTWKPLPQRMVEQGASPRSKPAPEGMRTIPAGLFDFRVTGIAVEGINQAGVDVQYPWEDQPRRFHRKTLQVPSFHIDTYPVTNAQYQRFVDASGYLPRDRQNYLRHWQDGRFAPELANRPVVWISLDDARAYARWAGKRLPTSWEWQYAAQGTDGRLYPWGNEWDAGRVPKPETGRDPGPPAPVDAHPGGASPFGVMDLVGNVWQWTDEFSDEHTRAAVLRGGSLYRPQGSHWYFPQAQRLDQHGKFLLMAPSLDRNAFTGFRCVKDVQQ